jgi:2-polyprenyl-3-methyl-5-hydroxy-6-metoxy-1,4-benzoquinol methylase
MTVMDMKAHWAQVYATKAATDVSWYQQRPDLSLEFIQGTCIDTNAAIIDVGAGTSTLVDHLMTSGYTDITLLDISEAALEVAKTRIGSPSTQLQWLVGDVTSFPFEQQRYDVWHDRAVFHFLTDPLQQQRYVKQVLHAVKPGGHVIIATFGLNGPDKCSGLPTARYDAATLQSVFGSHFELIRSTNETHHTPWKSEQLFVYCHCKVV